MSLLRRRDGGRPFDQPGLQLLFTQRGAPSMDGHPAQKQPGKEERRPPAPRPVGGSPQLAPGPLLPEVPKDHHRLLTAALAGAKQKKRVEKPFGFSTLRCFYQRPSSFSSGASSGGGGGRRTALTRVIRRSAMLVAVKRTPPSSTEGVSSSPVWNSTRLNFSH